METFLVREADQAQLDALMDFFRSDERETLPIPAYADLKDALSKQSLLVVMKEDDGAIAATAGYFEYARSNDAHAIYELAGTRVKNLIGRVRPFSLQQLLISLRVFQIALTDEGPVSLISSARSEQSIKNLESLKMEPILPMPRWFEFDTCSWTRMAERSEWRHFVATQQTMDQAINVLRQFISVGDESVWMTSRKQSDGSFASSAITLRFGLNFLFRSPAVSFVQSQQGVQRPVRSSSPSALAETLRPQKNPFISLSFPSFGAKSPPRLRPPHPWRLAARQSTGRAAAFIF